MSSCPVKVGSGGEVSLHLSRRQMCEEGDTTSVPSVFLMQNVMMRVKQFTVPSVTPLPQKVLTRCSLFTGILF